MPSGGKSPEKEPRRDIPEKKVTPGKKLLENGSGGNSRGKFSPGERPREFPRKNDPLLGRPSEETDRKRPEIQKNPEKTCYWSTGAWKKGPVGNPIGTRQLFFLKIFIPRTNFLEGGGGGYILSGEHFFCDTISRDILSWGWGHIYLAVLFFFLGNNFFFKELFHFFSFLLYVCSKQLFCHVIERDQSVRDEI